MLKIVSVILGMLLLNLAFAAVLNKRSSLLDDESEEDDLLD